MDGATKSGQLFGLRAGLVQRPASAQSQFSTTTKMNNAECINEHNYFNNTSNKFDFLNERLTVNVKVFPC